MTYCCGLYCLGNWLPVGDGPFPFSSSLPLWGVDAWNWRLRLLHHSDHLHSLWLPQWLHLLAFLQDFQRGPFQDQLPLHYLLLSLYFLFFFVDSLAVIFLCLFSLNTLLYYVGSSGYVPFSTFFYILVFFLLILFWLSSLFGSLLTFLWPSLVPTKATRRIQLKLLWRPRVSLVKFLLNHGMSLPVVLYVVGIFVVEFFIPFVVLFHLVLCLWSSTSSSLRFGWVATITCLASCSLSSVFSFLLLQSYLLLSPTLYSVLRTIIGGGTLFSLLDSVLSMFLSSRSTTSLLPLQWPAWLLLSNVWGIFSILQNHSIDSLLYFPFPSSWLLDSLDS